MLYFKYSELLERLFERTKNGVADWQATPREDEYIIYLQGYSISLQSSFSSYVIAIRNDKGKVIDEFTVWGHDLHWEKVNEIYTTARRKALKIDEVVEEVLKQLRSA
ncbi:MAG: hypothetical protein M3430_10270 [Acidobacteriota bacterium]|nr:hypothetical protein [Acidobacteriota bacterium]